MDEKHLNYKGFQSTCDYSTIDGVYFGKILNINEFITFEAENKEELYEEFVSAVEAYLSGDKPQNDLDD